MACRKNTPGVIKESLSEVSSVTAEVSEPDTTSIEVSSADTTSADDPPSSVITSYPSSTVEESIAESAISSTIESSRNPLYASLPSRYPSEESVPLAVYHSYSSVHLQGMLHPIL